jgi:hypothetical protein
MANITIGDEKAAREALRAFLATFPILGNVHTRRRRIQNRGDYVSLYGVANSTAGNIVRFLEIEFLQVADSDIEGDEDCPVAIITYGLHLFHEFFDGTADSNSQDDFVSAILTVRDAILNNREFDAGGYNGVCDPVTQPEFAQFGNDSFSDALGHWTDLNLKVNFYDD